MKYNGQELIQITTPQVFDPPKEMLVWDCEDDTPKVQVVWGIAPHSVYPLYRVLSLQGSYKYCAEIPQQQPKRATNIQLSEWLAKGNGMWARKNEGIMFTTASFSEKVIENEVDNDILIHPFGKTEWLEPTLENMGMDGKDEA